MTRWEYRSVPVPLVTRTRTEHLPFFKPREYVEQRYAWLGEPVLDAWLNDLGNEGWELVKLETSTALFKRPKQGAPYR